MGWRRWALVGPFVVYLRSCDPHLYSEPIGTDVADNTDTMAERLHSIELRDRVRSLAAGASVEISPADTPHLASARDLLDQGREISITWLPKDSVEARIEAAVQVRRAGFEPAPHIAARFLRSREELRGFLAGVTQQAGARRILLIGGDRPDPAGPFHSGLEVLQTGLIEASGVEAVGLALHPEAHPQVEEALLAQAFADKADYLAKAGLKAFAVTQLCFDSNDISRSILDLRRSARDMPVRVGLAGPTSVAALARFAVRCGVGASTRMLTSRTGSLAKLLTDAGPDPIIRDLAEHADLKALEPLGLHIFPFGGLLKTCRFLHALSEGRFHISAEGGGLDVA